MQSDVALTFWLQPVCDLLIVMGTSMAVSPFNQLPGQVTNNVPRLLLNRELVRISMISDCVPSLPPLAAHPASPKVIGFNIHTSMSLRPTIPYKGTLQGPAISALTMIRTNQCRWECCPPRSGP